MAFKKGLILIFNLDDFICITFGSFDLVSSLLFCVHNLLEEKKHLKRASV